MSGLRAVILAAGKGKRMKSTVPKVLHKLCGRTLFEHVLASVREAGARDIVAVASPQAQPVIAALGVRTVVQHPPKGTGDAARLAMAELPGDDPVLIVSADMPLLPPALLRAVYEVFERTGAAAALLTAHVPLPTSFGRIMRDSGRVARIVESADATADEQLVTEVNASVYCFDAAALRGYLTRLSPANAQAELYLTDCIADAVASGALVEAVTTRDYRHVIGVDTNADLARARNIMQRRILRRHMLAGVSIIDPATTYVDVGAELGRDVTLLPQTHVLGASQVQRGASIGPNTTILDSVVGESATVTYSVVRESSIGAGATVGPFAHLRGNTRVEDGAHIGNFVELKNSVMGKDAKAGHLAYLGDAEIGERANIGAGTITCNYDGKRKNKTSIGAGAFIGSNSSLVAPVEIGEEALTGAGSVVTHDVPAGERVAGNPARPLPKKDVS